MTCGVAKLLRFLTFPMGAHMTMKRKLMNSGAAAAVLGLLTLGIGQPAWATFYTVGNTDELSGQYWWPFGVPDTQTYGEVITPPASGYMTSFTLYLNGPVGALAGGVGSWNGPSAYALGGGVNSILYQSGPVASVGPQAFTFHPDINVTGGSNYVLYLTVYGIPGAYTTSTMPVAGDGFGMDYAVWNNYYGGGAPGPGSSSWNYFLNIASIFGEGGSQYEVSYTVSNTPLPAALPMFGAALAGLGGFGFWRRRKAS